MLKNPLQTLTAAACLAFALSATPALAQSCGSTAAAFGPWLEGFKQRARAAGVSQAAIDKGLAGVTYNPTVINLDRNQKSFRMSFEDFYRRRVSDAMIAKGAELDCREPCPRNTTRAAVWRTCRNPRVDLGA